MKKLRPPFEPKWPNQKALQVGYLTGRGHQSTDIAAFLNDGTSPETIRTMWQKSNLELIGKNRNVIYVPVKLTSYERKVLGKLANVRQISVEEWMRRVVLSTAIPQDLFEAVVPEDFK
jgi:hypothetical protein